jgi:thiamine biosynthesis lipoprotein
MIARRLSRAARAGALCAALWLAAPWSFGHGTAAEQARAVDSGMSRQFRYIMGTSIQVQVFGGDAALRAEGIDEAFAAITEIDRLMSNYRDDSELTAINKGAVGAVVRVSDPMLSVLEGARLVSERSGGAFDVTVGPLVKLWGFHDKKPHVPSAAELAAVRELVDYRRLLIDRAAKSVRFERAGMEIDLGGIAKGFAVELAAGVIKRRGLAGFLDAGGNQYLLGHPPGKTRWSVGVRDPRAADQMLGTLDVDGGSVSTSAGYATFLAVDGKRYGHILDPRTLRPSDASLSVTVVSPDGTFADAVSTAAFVLGPVEGLRLIDRFPNMAGLIAYRTPDGRVAVALSTSLTSAWHPAGS